MSSEFVDPGLLTADEQEAMNLSAKLANKLHTIIGEGELAEGDWSEAALHIHNIQHMIMAQAAARAYPHLFRRLGHRGEWHKEPEPGPCGDPKCYVLHADPANPIHPPDYVDSRTEQR